MSFLGPDLLKTSIVRMAALAALSAVAASAAACEQLRLAPGGLVVQVTDGDTLVLDNGLTVRLIGMQAPKLPLGREGFDTWPLAEKAKVALEALTLNKSVRLGYGGEEVDRYERALAHVFVAGPEGEIWAQQAMVAQGLARVYSFPDNRQCLDQLLAFETRARAMGLGIWSDPYYSVRAAARPDDLTGLQGHYELVEGRVLLADKAGGRVYLNFGRSFRHDFTAVIEAAAQRLFVEDGFDPLVLEGALVRIRGWVDNRDGPRIEVTHPEQIEVLATR